MLRYAIAIAGAVALISTAAFAEVGDMGTTKVITKSSPDGMAQKKVVIHRNDNAWGPSKKVVIKRHDTGYGAVVTKKKIIRGDNMYGSSMPHRTIIKERY
ncbi:MAG TPA: hypothetical protein VGN21_13230 [Stellaceae bacterium]|jgi:hypothetical protein